METIEITTEKKLLRKGVVEKITKLSSMYGASFRINMAGGSSVYFNAQTEDSVYKLFEVNKTVVFSTTSKTRKNGEELLLVDQVFYCL